jgi:hypothetical protein
LLFYYNAKRKAESALSRATCLFGDGSRSAERAHTLRTIVPPRYPEKACGTGKGNPTFYFCR